MYFSCMRLPWMITLNTLNESVQWLIFVIKKVVRNLIS